MTPGFRILFLVSMAIGCLWGCKGDSGESGAGESSSSAESVSGGAVIKSFVLGRVTGGELATLLASGDDVLLLDVRTPGEFSSGRIGNAVNIPIQNLAARVDELEGHRNRTIVVYCESGIRSMAGANLLVKRGFSKVSEYSGGMRDWRRRE